MSDAPGKPWRVTGGYAQSVQQALSARSGGGLAAAWARGVAAYLKVCALLVPREMKVEHSGGIKAMTDEEIERSIELIKAMIAERDAGGHAKVIEGEAEVVPGLPAPGSGGTKMPKV